MRAAVAVLVVVGVGACGGSSSSSQSGPRTRSDRIAPAPTSATTAARRVSTVKRHPPALAYPRLVRASPGVTLITIDQRLFELHLHSGTSDAGAPGWRFGPSVAGAERGRLVAAFNGGFRLSVGAGGFISYGRAGAALRDGLGSVVTYADGTTDIGAWHHGVPVPGHAVVSVRQNLPLLVDHGQAASTLDCLSCWGATLGGVLDPARSALGIKADGRLVWAGGEHLTVGQLASALLGAGVVRAVELDINPEWVAAYVYRHHGGHGPLAVVPVVPGQNGIPGAFLAPWSRDFFTVVAR